MVQAVNTQAIWTLASVLRRPTLLVPHVSAPSISQVNFEAMYDCAGVRAIVFDKDNTLTRPYDNTCIHPDAVDGLQRAMAVFGKDRVAILSNSAGTADDVDHVDAKELEERLGIPVIRHVEKKPGGLSEVLAHFHLEDDNKDAVSSSPMDPARLCVVGDRLLTDIVFGNLHGMLTVHVLPLCQGKDNAADNWTAKLLRPLENRLLYGNSQGRRRWLPQRYIPHKYWPGEEKCPLRL